MNESDVQEIQNSFTKMVEDNPDMPIAFAAIKTLLKDLETHESGTLTGLIDRLKELQEVLMRSEKAGASVSSGTELFLRFITLASSLEYPDLQESRRVMIDRGRDFLRRNDGAREKITRLCEPFIMDDMTILTHSRSRAVRDTLIAAKKSGKNFRVFVTESQLDRSGVQLQKELEAAGLTCTVILDAAVAYTMEQVDCVLVGAEGVVENGGCINKIGSLGVAMCAHHFQTPVYVLAECVKFVRLYPLSQRELPDNFKFSARTLRAADTGHAHPLVDYTPPRYISLLFTDLGVLTPAAVSDELIQLYL